MIKTKEQTTVFWLLYDLSLLETIEIIFAGNLIVEYRIGIIAILGTKPETVLTWHGVAGHE